MWTMLASLVVLLHTNRGADAAYSLSISESDYYATVSLDVGTPSQSFTVLLDTTNKPTWIFGTNATLDSDQDSFFTQKSVTWISGSAVFNYTYENATTNGTEGTDTLILGSLNITGETVGLADYNQYLFEEVEVSGAISLGRTSNFVKSLTSGDEIEAVFTIDIDSTKVHFGTYSGSYKNSSEIQCITTDDTISDYWSFSIDSMATDSVPSLLSCDDDCYGVIDAASPYLTFSMSKSSFTSLWTNIAGTDNCDYSTLECDSKSDIATYLDFTIGNNTYYMERSDYYYDDKLHIQWEDPDGDDTIVYFGRPLLKTLVVTLDARNDTMNFSYSKTSGNTDKWTVVIITAACMAAFAILFFGIFFWKFKIPAAGPGQGTREEQENIALLGGQAAHAQQHQPLGQPPPPERLPPPTSGPAQAVGSSTGASQTSDPDEIRRRRLQFLESQQNQDQE